MLKPKSAVVAALLAIVCALAVLLVGVASGAQAPDSVKPTVDFELPVPTAAMREQAQEEAAERVEKLALPAAVEKRRESRTAFSAFGPVEAKDLAVDSFGEVVTGSRAPGPVLGKGERVERYIGDLWAKVDRGEGKQPGIARSMVPMLAEDASGEKAPVDLDLEGDGSVLKPKNPLVDLELDRDASGGVRLTSSGVGVRPLAPLAGKAELQVVGDEKAFWSGVDADTDYLVAPVSAGFESFIQVRSENAPEQFSLAVDVPKGAELRDQGEQRGIDVVDPARPEKEQVLAHVTKPLASDADGTSVEVAYAIEGSTIVLRYPHRGQDLHYPLLVDPVTEDFYAWGIPDPGALGFGYGVDFPPGAGLYSAFDGSGLILYGFAGVAYQANRLHGWYWTAPGDSFIYRADFPFVDHALSHSNPAAADEVIEGLWDPRPPTPHWNAGSVREPPSFVDQGIASPWSTTAALTNKYKKHCLIWVAGPECGPGTAGSPAGTPGNVFVFQQHWINGGTPTTGPYAYLDGPVMQLTEFNPPSVLTPIAHGALADWNDDTNAPAVGTVDVTGRDDGLGTSRLELDNDTGRVDGNGDGIDDDALDWVKLPCDGSLIAPCAQGPDPLQSTLGYQTRPNGAFDSNTALAEGITQAWLRALDIVDNVGQRAIPVRIDRSVPTVSLSGPLTTWTGTGTASQNLHVDATDGTSGGTDAQQRSGIEQVDVLVDGTRVRRFSRTRGEWLLRNTNSAGDPDTTAFANRLTSNPTFNPPVVGDWNNDGKDTIGMYWAELGQWEISNANSHGDPSTFFVSYDFPNSTPIVGDWDGDGDDTVGLFSRDTAQWRLRNSNTAGSPDVALFQWGNPTDLPIVGDWNNDGRDTVGLFRPSNNTFYLRNDNSNGSADVTFSYGSSASPNDDVPVVGDWDGDGDDTVGMYRRSQNRWMLRNTNAAGSADINFVYGTALDGAYDDLPVAGNWDGVGGSTAGIFERSCARDSCPLSRDWSYRPTDQYGDSQTIKVVATDRVGHKTEQTLNVVRNEQGRLIDPVDGARTSGRLALQASLAGGGATQTKFQYRRPFGVWTDMPVGALTDVATGLAPSCGSGSGSGCLVGLAGTPTPKNAPLYVDLNELATPFSDEWDRDVRSPCALSQRWGYQGSDGACR